MNKQKFVELSPDEQHKHVAEKFEFKKEKGWFTADGLFAGRSTEDVIAALIDLEDAEINSIGDCMTGFCVTPPTLEQFVRKP